MPDHLTRRQSNLAGISGNLFMALMHDPDGLLVGNTNSNVYARMTWLLALEISATLPLAPTPHKIKIHIRWRL
jgi:hypothetical protein